MEDKGFNKRNVLVLIFEILLIAIAVGGLTFAASTLLGGSTTIIKFGEYNVDYVGSTEINVLGLEPISDSLINYDTKDNVIRLEFSLRGVDTNEKPENLIYDIMLSDINIDCSLLNEYTKWRLYKEEELIYSGNFSPSFDGNILTDNYRLTESQQKLPLSTDKYDNYVLIIWISEACEDLTTCELVSQNGILNSDMSMKVFIALMGGIPVQYEREPNMDATCVNKPELYEGMIPVYYDNGDYKIADKTNSKETNAWYNYGESKWANTVFVSDYTQYSASKVGTVIKQEDIIGYYVWIPRFKYKLWNNGVDTTDSYNAYEKGIDIVFESGVNSSGDLTCNKESCVGIANKYLTHPAFQDNRGFWISKYEISDGVKFVPNVESLRNKTLDEYKNLVNGLSITYGLGDVLDSHVVTNLEWGATLYLSHSKYGVCVDGSCKDIGINETYVSENNKQDTTTRNVYGVYDMAGGAYEYALYDSKLGTGINEVRINNNETWYHGMYFDINNDYILRGGNGMFSTSDIGMIDTSTRSVLVSK